MLVLFDFFLAVSQLSGENSTGYIGGYSRTSLVFWSLSTKKRQTPPSIFSYESNDNRVLN